jgi:hypothetical protein
MCKEMPVIPVNMVVDTKRIIGNNERLRRFHSPQKNLSMELPLRTSRLLSESGSEAQIGAHTFGAGRENLEKTWTSRMTLESNQHRSIIF